MHVGRGSLGALPWHSGVALSSVISETLTAVEREYLSEIEAESVARDCVGTTEAGMNA